MNRILIAEDEPRIVTFLEKGLRANGFTTAVAQDAHEALLMAQSDKFDLLILDLGLPVKDGLTVIEELRGRGEQLPIIILTARDDVSDKIAGLEGGANDYMTKPFSFEELLARVRARLRDNRLTESKEERVLSVGEIVLDLRTHQVRVEDRLIELPNNGIPYGAIAQLTLQPVEDIGIGLTYVRSYNDLDTGTGSELANDPFDDESERVTANSYGVQVTSQVSPVFTLGGWVGYTKAIAKDLSGRPEANIFNYAVTLAFQDLARKGDLAGVVIGQPPKVTRNDLSTDLRDKGTSLHLEAFYRFQATKDITITPGLLVITNPEHDKNNDTTYVGTVRTTFSF